MNSQIELLPASDRLLEQLIPSTILRALDLGATTVASVSGGKDSGAMLRYLRQQFDSHNWGGNLIAVFADLGRIEWMGTTEQVLKDCREQAAPLKIVQRAKGGMIDRWRERFETIAAQGNEVPWVSSSVNRYCTSHQKTNPIDQALRKIGDKPWVSSSSNRYCTSDQKRGPIDIHLREAGDLVISCVGLRAQESPGRAKKPLYRVRSQITTKRLQPPKDCKDAIAQQEWADWAIEEWLRTGRKGRLVLDWHPIFHWFIEDVWAILGTSVADVAQRQALWRSGELREALEGFDPHWAYIASSSRLSCSQCILAGVNDLLVGANYNPLAWLEIALLELESGWGFKQDTWLASLQSQVLAIAPAHRRAVFQVLYETQRMERFSSIMALELLMKMPSQIQQFWNDEFLVALEQDTEAWK